MLVPWLLRSAHRAKLDSWLLVKLYQGDYFKSLDNVRLTAYVGSPAPSLETGSHRTHRADFQQWALQTMIHSKAIDRNSRNLIRINGFRIG